jgi:hypothetical protein
VLLMVQYSAGAGWKMIPAGNIIINDDGTVTVILDEASPVAFLTLKSQITVSPGAPKSPQTGDTGPAYWMICAAAFAVFGVSAVMLTIENRKKTAAGQPAEETACEDKDQ